MGVKGPLFISIGDAEKLTKFLELNPKVDKSLAFVDDSPDFKAYEAAGFDRKLGDKVETMPKLAAPQLDFGQWWDYIRNVAALAPLPKGAKIGDFPEGVTRLGGTFVLRDDEVVYGWSDVVPGDTPEIDNVMAAVKKAAA